MSNDELLDDVAVEIVRCIMRQHELNFNTPPSVIWKFAADFVAARPPREGQQFDGYRFQRAYYELANGIKEVPRNGRTYAQACLVLDAAQARADKILNENTAGS